MDWYLIQCNSDDKWALLFFRATERARVMLGAPLCVERWPLLTVNETEGGMSNTGDSCWISMLAVDKSSLKLPV